jgi:Tetratricopeptide repeat
MARTKNDEEPIMFASWGLGWLCLRQGDLARALPQLERAMGICQDAVLPAFFPRIAAALGEVYALSGRLADALPLLTQAMAQTTARERDLVGFQTLYHLSMGKVRLLVAACKQWHPNLQTRAVFGSHSGSCTLLLLMAKSETRTIQGQHALVNSACQPTSPRQKRLRHQYRFW